MSDRAYSIIISTAKYAFLNVMTWIAMVLFARQGWINQEDTFIIILTIVNCTALLSGKMQKHLDQLHETASSKEKKEK